MRFNIKASFLLLILVVVSLLSCEKDDKDKIVISETAVITKFYLYDSKNDAMDDYYFTIDNDKKEIYNVDSMLFKTKIDSLIPMITPKFHAVYINDTIDLYALDSSYIDFTKDVSIKVVAADKKTSATYKVKVNVHQVDPDTFVWKSLCPKVFDDVVSSERALWVNERMVYFAVINNNLSIKTSTDGISWENVTFKGLNLDLSKVDVRNIVASKDCIYISQGNIVYTSSDAINWTAINTSGTDIASLLCYLNGKLIAISKSNKVVALVNTSWTEIGNLPDSFPVRGAAVSVANDPSGKARVFVVGGIDSKDNYLSSVWSSYDGAYWTNMIDTAQFTSRTEAAVVQYADGLMLFGGLSSDGSVVKDAQLYSKDFGMNWSKPASNSVIDSTYVPRYGLSLLLTEKGYLYFIGGRTAVDKSISDVWMGYRYASLDGFKK